MDLMFSSNDIKNFVNCNINSSHPILKALKNGKLIIFVGSGMSVHLGIPSWREFALKYLDLVYKKKNSTSINYKTRESLKLEDTKKILSICKFVADNNMSREDHINAYKEWFEVDINQVRKYRLYEKLYSLNAIYVTTNYDNALDLLAEQIYTREPSIKEIYSEQQNITENTRGVVYYEVEKFKSDILKIGNVIHIHGSIKNTDNLIISYEDYINRYYRNHSDEKSIRKQQTYMEFLSTIFKKDYIVLFVGYGLEELEILQYLFEGELKDNENIYVNDRYFLLSCYSDDFFKISYLADYYKRSYKINIIPYDMTESGHEEIEEFLECINKFKYKDELHENKKVDELKRGFRLIEEI